MPLANTGTFWKVIFQVRIQYLINRLGKQNPSYPSIGFDTKIMALSSNENNIETDQDFNLLYM